MSRPTFELISAEQVTRILDEAFALLAHTGVRVSLPEARALLASGGAAVDENAEVVRLPEGLIRAGLQSAPHSFTLYNLLGEARLTYGDDQVHFDPGSAAVNVLDADSGRQRPAQSADLLRIIQVTEGLPQFAAQSTAVVCADIPVPIGDLYRLYLVLLHSAKPVITGAFTAAGGQRMLRFLEGVCGGAQALRERPVAVFDVCPTPPLVYSAFAAQGLIDLARAGVPAENVSMPLAGSAGPVTLLGSVVQHAAECLAGIALHQCAAPGAPIVWGGAPAIFDMRHGTTPMGAVETAMMDAAYAQVGRSLGLPTHTYLAASDAKLVDAQAGLESGISAVLAALAGVSMVSGAGMLDFLNCHSAEKLVVDAEAVRMALRLREGMHELTPTLGLEFFTGIDFRADFLKQKVTRQLFRAEQSLPSAVIDRGSVRAWEEAGRLDTWARARLRVEELVAAYTPPELPPAQAQELHDRMAAEQKAVSA